MERRDLIDIMAPGIRPAAEKFAKIRPAKQERGLYKPRPLPWAAIVLVLLFIVVAFSGNCIPAAVIASIGIAGILYCSLVEKEKPFALQSYKRAKARANSYNLLVDVFYAGRVFDDATTPDMFILECLEAPEPDIFLFTTRQAGKTEGMIRNCVEASIQVFDAAYVKMEQVEGDSKNSTYKITFSNVSDLDALAARKILYADLLELV